MTAKEQRRERLMPAGIPRYVRIYDNGGETFDRYTAIFTGRYAGRELGGCDYVGMSENPFHPQGYGQHGEAREVIDANRHGFTPAMGQKCRLGKRIPFDQLPEPCQQLVKQDYRQLWGL